MAVDTESSRDKEEDRLLESSALWHAKEQIAAHQLSHPPHSMLYPEYRRMADALEALRRKCVEKRNAVRAYRQKMRNHSLLVICSKECRAFWDKLFANHR
jgi:hypothetical protein